MKPLPSDWKTWSAARLEAEVRAHNARYWDDAAPEISDYEYDQLVEHLRAVAPEAAVLQAMGPTAGDRSGTTVAHAMPMLSLDKAYDEDTLQKWAAKFEGELVMTPKVDGVACSIRYAADGHLVVAATRGNGVVGEDITANVRRIPDVPDRIDTDVPVEVRGEVYIPISTFKALDGDFSSPRNTAAGGLKQKDADASAQRGLRFYAYDVVGPTIDTELHKFEQAAAWGFTPVECKLLSRDEVQSGYEAYVARRASLDYEIDGVVYKANRLDEQERLGATSHHPRYAIAYKLQGDSAPTTLLAVEWSVSRTGVITPVGLVEPVSLSGAMVGRLSLHNWGLVRDRELAIGAEIVAMRRGGVIPHLEAVTTPGHTPIEPPATCPSCDHPARVVGDFVECTSGGDCPAQRVGVLSHYAKVTDIEGFGQVWLETLVADGVLKDPTDFYRLTAVGLTGYDRMGTRLAEKLLQEIEKTRTQPLAMFLRALGVAQLGKTASKTLAARYGSLAAVRAATEEELIELPKFAALMAEIVLLGLRDRAWLIDGLLEFVTVEETAPQLTAPAPTDGPLSGQSFLFTGTLVVMKREEAQAQVVALGGAAASGVSKTLTYLVVGDAGKAGSKVQKAEKAGVKVLTEGEFVALLQAAE